MKWAKNIKRHSTEENIEMADNHMKGCSASLAIGKMQNNTTMRYYYTPTGMTMIKKYSERTQITDTLLIGI